MGGSIRVVVKADNQINIQSRWTNPLPDFVKHPLFIERDPQHIAGYLSGESPYRLRPQDELFSPDGYGLDVFDMDNKRIYTTQGYCSYDQLEFPGISLDRREPAQVQRYRDLWDKKYMGLLHFKKFDQNWRDPANQTLTVTGELSYDEALKLLEKDHRKDFHDGSQYVWFKVLWEQNGWQHKRYEETAAGYEAMLADLQADGYNLSAASLEDWRAQIAERKLNEEE